MKTAARLIGLFVLLSAGTAAEIYRWVDKDGRVQYGDKPPQDVASEPMQVAPQAADSPDEGELRRRRLLEQADQDVQRRLEERRARSAAEQAEKEKQAAREQHCLEGRMQLEILQTKLPVYRDAAGKLHAKWRYDSYQGERNYLDDTTRAGEIERVRHTIETYCQHPDDVEAQVLARKKWLRSDRCATSRAELKALEQPEARASRQAIREKIEEVEEYCSD